MSPFAGPFFAGAGLLAVAGGLKVVRPLAAARAMRDAGLPGSRTTARALGVVELAVAGAALAVGGRVPALLVGACYVGFALFIVQLRRRSGAAADCGCFGTDSTPATGTHVVVNGGLATVAALAAVWPTTGLPHVMSETPLAGIPFLGFTLVCGWLVLVLLTVVPELQAAAGGPARAARR
ncbi:MAG: hypothetical protein JWM05_3325 [Acidimicrobiales bacterium]|nr:hypothetical protein [Acidimicrobiales bacterium]